MKPYNNKRVIYSHGKLRRKPLLTVNSYKDCGIKRRPAMSISAHHKMRTKTFVGSYH